MRGALVGFVKKNVIVVCMGEPGRPRTRDTKLRAIHKALIMGGYGGMEIALQDWNRILGGIPDAFNSRQEANDATWKMDALGLIQRRKGVGVVVLEPVEPPASTIPASDPLGLPQLSSVP